MKQDTPALPTKPKWEVLEDSGPVCEDGFCFIPEKPAPEAEQKSEKTEEKQP